MEGTADDRAEVWRLAAQRAAMSAAEKAAIEIQLRDRIRHLEGELARAHGTLTNVVASRSWTVTEPLRRLRARRFQVPQSQAAYETTSREELFERRMAAAYEARWSNWPQSESPGFNQKFWQRRLTDRRPILKTYCDKAATLEHVRQLLPAQVLPERLTTADSMAQLSFSELPDEYVVKVTHASGGSVVVWDGPESPGYSHEVWVRRAYHRGDVPFEVVRAELGRCLEHDFGWDLLEWGYLDVPRTVAVDRLYRGADGGLPDDLSIYVFHGRAEVIRQASDRQRSTERWAGMFDRDWKTLPIRHGRATPAEFPRPEELDFAIELAEELCTDDETMRVDFLLTADGLRFGEITPYTMSGNVETDTDTADQYLGSFW